MEKIKTIILSALSNPLITTILVTIFSAIINYFIVKSQIKYTDSVEWESNTRLKAEKVAEYLAFASQLEENSSKEDYIKANNMSLELAMWLPADLYREVVYAVKYQNLKNNNLSAIISVRKYLLKDKAEDLSQNDIAYHYPGIGKQNAN